MTLAEDLERLDRLKATEAAEVLRHLRDKGVAP